MSRILLKSVESPFSFGESDGSVCKDPVSDEPVSEGVLKAFAAALEETWPRPTGAAAKATPSIMLEVCLGESGRTLRRPFLVEPSGSLEPIEAEALVKALAAVEKAAPLAPASTEVERWRRILVLFDPLQGEDPSTSAAGGSAPGPSDGKN